MKLKRGALKKKRLLAGLSQEALAKKVGTSRQAISFFESGKRKPHPSTLQRVVDALKCDISDIADMRV